MARVYSAIPRGFSRFYILHLLKEKSLTGKEIIEEAERSSGGVWKPSPGLVYPLLGRLTAEALVLDDDGRYTLTAKGVQTMNDYAQMQKQIDKQLEVLRRLGLYGKFVGEEAVDRVLSLATVLHEDMVHLPSKLRRRVAAKYKSFLERELRRMESEI